MKARSRRSRESRRRARRRVRYAVVGLGWIAQLRLVEADDPRPERD